MRLIHSTLVLAALLFGAALLGHAQTGQKEKEIDQKKGFEKFNGKTLFEWSTDLKDKDVSVRVEAMAALKFYGPAARREVPAIFKGMIDPDISMKVNSIITLGYVGVDPKDGDTAVKELKTLLRHSQLIVRFQAISTLKLLGQQGIDAVTDATQALSYAVLDQQNSWEIRSAAASALGYVGWTSTGFDRHAFSALLRAANDNTAAVRLSAVWSLIVFGKPTSPDDLRYEEKVLQGLTVDKPQAGRTGGKPFAGRVAIWAYVCLMRIGDVSEGYLTGISKYLKSKDLQTRIHAARAFAVIHVNGGSQAPALIDALVNEEEPAALVSIITALGSMGDLAKDAELQLKRLAGHKEQAVRDAVNKALQDIKEKKRKDDDAPQKRKK